MPAPEPRVLSESKTKHVDGLPVGRAVDAERSVGIEPRYSNVAVGAADFVAPNRPLKHGRRRAFQGVDKVMYDIGVKPRVCTGVRWARRRRWRNPYHR